MTCNRDDTAISFQGEEEDMIDLTNARDAPTGERRHPETQKA